MNSFVFFCVTLALVASSVNGGSQRFVRQSGWGSGGWGSGSGWAAGPGTNINTVGASQAVGVAAAAAEHDATLSVSGSSDVPALLSLGAGSSVGLSQSASNYQQSQINSDGSSAVYQGNYASNDGYGNEYLYGNAQGLNVDANSNGWSVVEGEGAIGQADTLEHDQYPTGWKAPQ